MDINTDGHAPLEKPAATVGRENHPAGPGVESKEISPPIETRRSTTIYWRLQQKKTETKKQVALPGFISTNKLNFISHGFNRILATVFTSFSAHNV